MNQDFDHFLPGNIQNFGGKTWNPEAFTFATCLNQPRTIICLSTSWLWKKKLFPSVKISLLKVSNRKKQKNKYHFNMLKLKGRPSDFPRRSLNQSGLTPSSSLSAPKNRGLTLGGQLGRQWAVFFSAFLIRNEVR